MKRTITGWIRKDKLNKPFWIDQYTSRIRSFASTTRKTWCKEIADIGLVRVKITVETIKPKKRTLGPLPCDFCGGIPIPCIDTDKFTLVDTYHYRCVACNNSTPEFNSAQEALKAWNKQQKS